jgi:hypothetical protein
MNTLECVLFMEKSLGNLHRRHDAFKPAEAQVLNGSHLLEHVVFLAGYHSLS